MRFWFVVSYQFHPKTGCVGLNFQIYHIFFNLQKKVFFLIIWQLKVTIKSAKAF